MIYVLRRDEDGAYVAPPGRRRSYTKALRQARTFNTRADAEGQRCGNERVVPVRELLQRPER